MIGVKKKIYTEKHHIFPKSIFGPNNSLVELTLKEHYVAHHLLWKYYQKKYGNKDNRTKSMLYAYWRMSNDNEYEISSRNYEIIRQEYVKLMTGENNPMYGKTGINSPFFNIPRAQNIKDKISKKLVGMKVGENHPLFGRIYSDYEKEEMKISCSWRSKPVKRIDIITGEIKIFKSLNEAAREGYDLGNISSCCRIKRKNNKRKVCKGYYWEFSNE